jgi:4-aminobutyrate aminotransferase/(S)-3-amino-2-methylpropionate transaminase
VIEPVIGEGGFIPVPHKFLRKIREVCDGAGAVMIADEIQSGSGRTGKMWAIEHSGVIPDLVISAKSLGAGMPVSAVTGRVEILDSPHVGGVGSTYGGNPLACVAALKALEILESPGFLERAKTLEHVVREVFEPMKSEIPVLGDVRGVGAMMALEFVKDKASKEPWSDFAMNTIKEAGKNGVILIRAGLYTNCIRFLPALDIPQDILREALGVVANAIRTTHKAMMAPA